MVPKLGPNLAIPQNPLENLSQLTLSHPAPVSDSPAVCGALEFAFEKRSCEGLSFVLESRTGRACGGTAVREQGLRLQNAPRLDAKVA